MNAANSLETNPKPAADQRIPEPSMEEILASIRRIIADDESLPGRKDVAAEVPAPIVAEAPELDMSHPSDSQVAAPDPQGALTDAHGDSIELVTSSEPVLSVGELVSADVLDDEPAAHRTDVPLGRRSAFMTGYEANQAIVEPAEVVPSARHEEPAVTEHDRRQAHVAPEPMSLAMDAPVEQDMHGLSPDALFSDATHQSVAAAFRTLAATRLTANSEELLDIARDMIRPLLKSWIDNNVPTMVERMVRAEIERVARGGR